MRPIRVDPATRPRRCRRPASGGPGPAPARPAAAAGLVLDDEESIRTFLRKALAAAGFDAIVAADGETAVERGPPGAPIDVALVDHRMPGMTGIDAYEAAVAIQPDLAGRWIFMSGDVLNPDLHAFAEARGIPLLAKPFDLITVTRSVARRRGPARPRRADRGAAQRG